MEKKFIEYLENNQTDEVLKILDKININSIEIDGSHPILLALENSNVELISKIFSINLYFSTVSNCSLTAFPSPYLVSKEKFTSRLNANDTK